MGFKLGRLLGKVASGVISGATGGRVRPSFSRPSNPRNFGLAGIVGTTLVPDSTVTTSRGVLPWQTTRTVSYYQHGANDPTNPGPSPDSGGAMVPASAACPLVWDGHKYVRTHLNKAGYVTRGGGTSRWPAQLVYHPPGSECVKTRHLNPANGRAAKHALRRIVAFHRMARSVERVMQRVARKHVSRAGGGGKKRCGCK